MLPRHDLPHHASLEILMCGGIMYGDIGGDELCDEVIGHERFSRREEDGGS
jgi:hypothetical protein